MPGPRQIAGDTRHAYFVRELLALKTVKSLTWQVITKRAGRRSLTAFTDSFYGKRVPALPMVLAYVEACEGDKEEWTRRWQYLIANPTAVYQPQENWGEPINGLPDYGNTIIVDENNCHLRITHSPGPVHLDATFSTGEYEVRVHVAVLPKNQQ